MTKQNSAEIQEYHAFSFVNAEKKTVLWKRKANATAMFSETQEHIGNRNVQANYTINGKQLAKVEQEKDLGVVISSDLKPSKQCSEVLLIN